MQDEQELRADSNTQRLDKDGHGLRLVNLDLELSQTMVESHLHLVCCNNITRPGAYSDLL